MWLRIVLFGHSYNTIHTYVLYFLKVSQFLVHFVMLCIQQNKVPNLPDTVSVAGALRFLSWVRECIVKHEYLARPSSVLTFLMCNSPVAYVTTILPPVLHKNKKNELLLETRPLRNICVSQVPVTYTQN